MKLSNRDVRASEVLPALRESAQAIKNPPAVGRRLGGRWYAFYSEPKCFTCMSLDFRRDVEIGLLMGRSAGEISRSLPERAGLSAKNIWEHSRRHLPRELIAQRVLLEERAQQAGKDIIEGANLIDYVTLGRATITRVYEDMMKGEISPSMQDAIGFSRVLHQWEQWAGGNVDTQLYGLLFTQYYLALKRRAPQAIQEAVLADIRTNPLAQELVGQIDRQDRGQGEQHPAEEPVRDFLPGAGSDADEES